MDAAEDVVHDTITMLIRNLSTIRDYERKRLVSYISRAVHNNSLNYYNKYIKAGGRTFYGFEDDLSESIPDDSYTPAERFEVLEEYEELGKAIKQLPERDRELLYLKYNMEYGDAAIGEIMGIKKDSVRQCLTRARRAARNSLSKEGALNG
jgi:RNA polymerase sigma-70 factor (ECF subfamily)